MLGFLLDDAAWGGARAAPAAPALVAAPPAAPRLAEALPVAPGPVAAPAAPAPPPLPRQAQAQMRLAFARGRRKAERIGRRLNAVIGAAIRSHDRCR